MKGFPYPDKEYIIRTLTQLEAIGSWEMENTEAWMNSPKADESLKAYFWKRFNEITGKHVIDALSSVIQTQKDIQWVNLPVASLRNFASVAAGHRAETGFIHAHTASTELDKFFKIASSLPTDLRPRVWPYNFSMSVRTCFYCRGSNLTRLLPNKISLIAFLSESNRFTTFPNLREEDVSTFIREVCPGDQADNNLFSRVARHLCTTCMKELACKTCGEGLSKKAFDVDLAIMIGRTHYCKICSENQLFAVKPPVLSRKQMRALLQRIPSTQ